MQLPYVGALGLVGLTLILTACGERAPASPTPAKPTPNGQVIIYRGTADCEELYAVSRDLEDFKRRLTANAKKFTNSHKITVGVGGSEGSSSVYYDLFLPQERLAEKDQLDDELEWTLCGIGQIYS